MNIANLLYATARMHPSRTALTDATGSHSYEKLAKRSQALANILRNDLGLEAQATVVLCMENCAEFVEILFACWSAGLTVVPVNSKLHPREVRYIIEDSGAKVCFATAGQWDKLVEEFSGGDDTKFINVQSAEYRAMPEGNNSLVVDSSAEDPAWAFYTSGTTGQPKGALISHRALMFMSLCYFADIDFVEPGDTQLHVAPLSHAAGLYSLPHIAKGGRQVIINSSFTPSEVFTAIAKYPRVSMFVAPTMLTRLLNAPEAKDADVSNVRTIIYGGGPMHLADLKRAIKLFGPRLYQLYGQGEAPMSITGISKHQHGKSVDPSYEKILQSVGYPRTGVEVKIINQGGEELPSGEIGEILTRSEVLMTGYLGISENPIRDGWLYTGDLGSLDEDGNLTLHGRSKEMIVSGGTNVYPREVEEVLLRHEAVAQCAVVGRPSKEWGEEVVAFVVPGDGYVLVTEELDALCLENIARFKRPKEYLIVDSLPTNHYGKVLKEQLRRTLMERARA